MECRNLALQNNKLGAIKMKKTALISTMLLGIGAISLSAQAAPMAYDCNVGSPGQPTTGCSTTINRTPHTDITVGFTNFKVSTADTKITCMYSLNSGKLKVDNGHLSTTQDFKSGTISQGNAGVMVGQLTSSHAASVTGNLTLHVTEKGKFPPGGGTFIVKSCAGTK